MNSMKELSSDMLQTVMKAALEGKLGYEKRERASKNIVSHWSVTCRNWEVVSNQLSIMFSDRKSA